MPHLHLLPFPHFYRLPAGQTAMLPITRNGLWNMTPFPFEKQAGPVFPVLTVQEYATGRTVRGLCGLLPAAAFTGGRVRPHENTLISRLERQRRLVLEDGGALGKPILLTVPSLAGLWQGLPGDPARGGLTYRGPEQAYHLATGHPSAAAVDLTDFGPLVVADGHHRAYTHAALAAEGHPGFQHLPVVIAGADELTIGAFLRVIEGDGMSLSDLLGALRPFFRLSAISEGRRVQSPGHWLLGYRGAHYHLARRPSDATDTGWLTRVVLPAAFGITDMRNNPRIHSIYPPAGEGGVVRLSPELREKITLLGYPISRERFFAEVAAGRVLPPKSTRFLPRIPSGLLVWVPT